MAGNRAARWQAGGKQLDSASPRESGSPELEVTAEQLAAGEEEGAASIVEVYAALLLGFVAEGSAHQQKVRVWPCLLPSKTQRWPSMMQISMKPTSFLRTWLPPEKAASLWYHYVDYLGTQKLS